MILAFRGQDEYLSNFYRGAPFTFEHRGKELPCSTVEHGFQAFKAEDPRDRKTIVRAATPMAAKKIGQRVRLRPDWEEIKERVMVDLVFTKFYMHVDLRKQLLQTRSQLLVEGNTWCDNEWGRCLCARCHRRRDTESDLGQNKLGKILMHVREVFQYACDQSGCDDRRFV